MVLLLSAVVSFTNLFASPHFTPLRDDLSIPEHCRDVKLSDFSLPLEKFFVGRKGAINMGYTFEYPLERNDARTLWFYFRSLAQGNEDLNLLNKIKKSPALFRDYQIILRNYQEQDFHFEAEGEVLEILAIHKLYQEFPENTYFITGGVEYHEEYSSKTIGELDLFVGHRDSCMSVAVGEAKLGTRRMLKKAREQIQRFHNFLINHNRAPIVDEYEPKVVGF